jgi:hypothetical protein
MAVHVAATEDMRNAYKIFIGKSEGSRYNCRRRDNIELILKIYVVKIRAGFIWLRRGPVNTVMNILFP